MMIRVSHYGSQETKDNFKKRQRTRNSLQSYPHLQKIMMIRVSHYGSQEKYAKLFLKLNTDYYAGLPSAVMFRTVGDYLRYALSKDYISETDLYTTDKIVLRKIEPHTKTDPKLNLLFDRMNNKIGFRNDPNDYTGKVFCKSRVVNPLCWHNGKIMKVSEVNPSWNGIIEQESKPREYFLKFDK